MSIQGSSVWVNRAIRGSIRYQPRANFHGLDTLMSSLSYANDNASVILNSITTSIKIWPVPETPKIICPYRSLITLENQEVNIGGGITFEDTEENKFEEMFVKVTIISAGGISKLISSIDVKILSSDVDTIVLGIRDSLSCIQSRIFYSYPRIVYSSINNLRITYPIFYIITSHTPYLLYLMLHITNPMFCIVLHVPLSIFFG